MANRIIIEKLLLYMMFFIGMSTFAYGVLSLVFSAIKKENLIESLSIILFGSIVLLFLFIILKLGSIITLLIFIAIDLTAIVVILLRRYYMAKQPSSELESNNSKLKRELIYENYNHISALCKFDFF